MEVSEYILNIRSELFDHGIYPSNIFPSTNTLMSMCKELHTISTIDYKISIKQWIEQATKYFPNLTEDECTSIFITYLALCKNNELHLPTISKKIEHKESEKLCDIRCFAIFLGIQVYANSLKGNTDSRKQMSDTPWPSQSHGTPKLAGNLSSPRSKTTKIQYITSEFQLIKNFIQNNIKYILTIMSPDSTNPDTAQLNSNEINCLRILFSIQKKDSPSIINNIPISSVFPYIANTQTSTTKFKVGLISEWIIKHLNIKEPKDYFEINSLRKAVFIKGEEIPQGLNLKIFGIEESQIYVNNNFENIMISGSSFSSIFVAASNNVCSIDRCENCQFIIASKIVRISNCVDCTYQLFTSEQPIIFGDNRSLVIGPHNAAYESLMEIIKRAKLAKTTTNKKNYEKPLVFKKCNESFSIQLPKDFMKHAVPLQFKENMIMLAPQEYLNSLNARMDCFQNLKEKITKSNLTPQQQKQLILSIQGFFKEYLISSNGIKGISEILKQIDQSQ